MKTAMQELIDEMDSLSKRVDQRTPHHGIYLAVSKFATEQLEKEKSQISGAFEYGRISFSVEIGGCEDEEEMDEEEKSKSYMNGAHYYNETYKKD